MFCKNHNLAPKLKRRRDTLNGFQVLNTSTDVDIKGGAEASNHGAATYVFPPNFGDVGATFVSVLVEHVCPSDTPPPLLSPPTHSHFLAVWFWACLICFKSVALG